VRGTIPTAMNADCPDNFTDPRHPTPPAEVALVRVHDARPEGYDGTCLRPLGLCELGGACETCWYRPDHPRFRQGGR